MAHKAIITRYSDEAFQPDGNITLSAYFICTEVGVAIPSGQVLVAPVALDASTPSGWTAAIKAAVAAWGVSHGCSDLVVANVFAPTYA